jgi:maltose O-acetyltransferase
VQIRLIGSGTLDIGSGCDFREGAIVVTRGRLTVGERVFIGMGSIVDCKTEVSIGAFTRLAERVSVHDTDHVVEPLSDADGRENEHWSEAISIGSRVWLGANVVVLRGVTIGDDTVVAANSVVTKSLPQGVLAAGAPARVMRELQP